MPTTINLTIDAALIAYPRALSGANTSEGGNLYQVERQTRLQRRD